MTARRNTKPKAEPTIDIDLEDLPVDNDVPEPIVEDVEDDAPAKARKYFSHANCDHARKGEAGKAARATCRRNIRAWLKAEAEAAGEVIEESIAV